MIKDLINNHKKELGQIHGLSFSLFSFAPLSGTLAPLPLDHFLSIQKSSIKGAR